MNKVFLIGNLTRDPEQTETPNGIAVCRFSIAVSRDFTNSDGERETDFFNIVVWRGRAENCGKYLKKGNKVAVIGSLQNRSYEDKDGVKRSVTDIVASEVEFLTPKTGEDSDTVTMSRTRETTHQSRLTEVVDDNKLPF